ncbi:hypothetical protein [uncultured Pelagimonas sp.]|uniref:hypothetical protein n=1 Tax=uncultured Pelagimonas sp. TaxID=1618102 RepID=UPI002633DEA9|nr:hypothetical protein [uncultured Pelagimonas sp.]
MPKFQVNIAQYVRAYGSVTVEAETAEQAAEMITLDLVRAEFEPHGTGNDLDYSNTCETCITEVLDEDTCDKILDLYQEVPTVVETLPVFIRHRQSPVVAVI